VAEDNNIVVLALDSVDLSWKQSAHLNTQEPSSSASSSSISSSSSSSSSAFNFSSSNKDIAFTETSLNYVFSHCHISEKKFGIAGFSDGAAFALFLGLINHQLFSHIMAFSAGTVRNLPVEEDMKFQCDIYVSHGTQDTVIPIEKGGRKINRTLQPKAKSLKYDEFDGVHEVPVQILKTAIGWFLQ